MTLIVGAEVAGQVINAALALIGANAVYYCAQNAIEHFQEMPAADTLESAFSSDSKIYKAAKERIERAGAFDSYTLRETYSEIQHERGEESYHTIKLARKQVRNTERPPSNYHALPSVHNPKNKVTWNYDERLIYLNEVKERAENRIIQIKHTEHKGGVIVNSVGALISLMFVVSAAFTACFRRNLIDYSEE